MSVKNAAKFHVGVKSLILNDKKEILLIKELNSYGGNGDFWDIPGGRMEAEKGIEETLRLEVNEELGISEFEITSLFDAVKSNLSKVFDNERIYLLLLVYGCNLKLNSSFKLIKDEHSELKWASIDEAKQLLSYKFSKSFVEKLDLLKK